MSHDSSDTDVSAPRPTTVIPQDTSTGIFKVKLGFTVPELILILTPVVLEAWIILTYFLPAEWQLWLVVGTAVGAAGMVYRTPDHITPRELIVRRLGGAWTQFRAPFAGTRARDIPGVVDVHHDADAVERRDGAQVALVEVAPVNLSQTGGEATDKHALATARQIDTKLSKSDTPAAVRIRRRAPTSIADQIEGLDEAADDDRPPAEVAVASDRADHAVEEIAEQGAMDHTIFIATWVHPGEVSVEDGSRLDSWANTRFVRPSDALRTEQHDELSKRVEKVRNACNADEGATTPLSADGIADALREYWVDVDADAGVSQLITRSITTAFAPSHVDAHHRHADVADHHTATFWVAGFPKYPTPGFLAPILEAAEIECDISLFIGRCNRESKMSELHDRIRRTGTAGIESDDSAEAEDAAQFETDLGHLRSHMRDNKVDASEVSAYITLRADDTETLTSYRDDLRDAATDAGITVEPAAGASRQLAGVVSTSPVGGDRLFQAMRGWLDTLVDSGGIVAKWVGSRTGTRTRWDMPPGAIGAMLPFSGGVRRDHDGILYGVATSVDDNALGMLQLSRERLTAPHRFFVGRSGSGKTFRETVNIVEELIRYPERRTVIIDIAENFDGVVELFDGERIVLGETTVNPFAVSEGDDLDATIQMLTNMFHIYLRHNAEEGVAESVRADLSTAIRETFRSVEIESGADAWRDSPTMHEFHDTLEAMNDNPDEYTVRDTDYETDEIKEHTGLLLSRLKPFVEGGDYGYLVADRDDPDGAADLNAKVTLFDMSDYQNTEGAEKGVLTMLVLSQAFSVAGDGDALTNVVVDEAHDVFSDASQADHFESTVRAGRNAGLCFDFLSQSGDDFDVETAGAIAGQCDVSVWGDLGEGNEGVPQQFGWSREQAETINGDLKPGDKAGVDYSEAMVDVDGDRYRTEFRVGPVVQAVAEYDVDDHGPFDEYLEDAIADAESESDDVQEVAT